MSLLKESVEKTKDISLEEANNISLAIATELYGQGFDMESLADIEGHIMELAEGRMRQLGCTFSTEEDLTYLAGLVVEISLYIGINIGRNTPKA